MNYLFGPVNSRRLGLSQGIDLIPGNICNFDCIYCEVGRTRLLTAERREYTPTAEILAEIDTVLADPARMAKIDVFTITATGEPTLHTGIGRVIRHIKAGTTKPVTVLTNGSLLSLAEVRRDLLPADIVAPSLDSALPRSFRQVNRPVKDLDVANVIDGLQRFRAEYPGQLWLEILLVKGYNDTEEDLAALEEAVARIAPDRVQVNTVARPPAESFARPLASGELAAIARRFGERAELIAPPSRTTDDDARPPLAGEILELLRRRPCTTRDLAVVFRCGEETAAALANSLASEGTIKLTPHGDTLFWTVASGEDKTSSSRTKTP